MAIRNMGLLEGASRSSGKIVAGARGITYRYALVLSWLFVAVLFGFLRPGTFATHQNLTTILGSQSVLIVVTVGVLFPLIAGVFDLSIGANLGFVAVLVADLNANLGWPIGFAVAAGLGAGVLVGLVNGCLSVLVGVTDMIVTIAMSTLLVGLSLGLANNVAIGGVDPWLTQVIRTRYLGLPLGLYYALVFSVIAWYLLRFTPVGRHLLVTGREVDAARLTGLPVQRLRIMGFVLSGFSSAVAGVFLTGQLGAADPASGVAFLLPAFSAAFLGVTVVTPGFFNVWGTLIAVYFLVTTVTGLEQVGVSSWIEQIFYGGVLIVAVTLSRQAERRRAF